MMFSSKRSIRAAVCAGVMALLSAGLAWAQDTADAVSNSIERVDAVQTGEGVILNIQLRSPVSVAPNSFSVTNPARVALDLPGTVNDLGRNSVEINQGDLRSVNVVQAQGRSRVVLNLRRPLAYTVSVKGNNVVVALGPMSRPRPSRLARRQGGCGCHCADPRGAMDAATSDFRRGPDGEGAWSSNLQRSGHRHRHPPAGADLVVDFSATLPDKLRRRLDVTDFGTPVQSINTYQSGRQRAHGDRAQAVSGSTAPTRPTTSS